LQARKLLIKNLIFILVFI